MSSPPDLSTLGVELSDVRIVDFSRVLAGPFATQVLAGLGADVVKIEFPSGDPSRAVGPYLGDRSLYYSSVNTGKRSIMVDPSEEEGRSVMRDLLTWADVVVHNFRYPAAEGLGLTPAALLAFDPTLVIVTVSGYGSGTTDAERAAYDLTIQAESGLMSITGEPGMAPVRSGVPISDLAAGMWAAIAITGGLLTQRRTGMGLHVEVPLFDASLSMLSYIATAALTTGEDPGPVGSGHHRLAPYRAYETQDGFIVIAVLDDKSWLPLCQALGLMELGNRTELRTVVGRKGRRAEIDRSIEQACRQRTSEEILASLHRKGVPAARVNTVREALTGDNATKRRRTGWAKSSDGAYAVVRGPFDPVDRNPRAAPTLGEHTEEVLASLREDQSTEGGPLPG